MNDPYRIILDDFQDILREACWKGKTQADIARLFDRERTWANLHMNCAAPFVVDPAFLAGLKELGYEIKIVKKEAST